MKEKLNQTIDKLFEKPLLGIFVSIMVIYLLIFSIGKLAVVLGVNSVGEYLVRLIVAAVISAIIYWFRGDKLYSCGFKKYGLKGMLCIMPVIVIATVIIGSQVVKGTITSVESVIFSLVFAFEAGLFEEFLVRGIPLGNTVWKADSFKSVMKLVIFSSFVFGFLHMGNIYRTGDIIGGFTQSIGALFAGLFFAAVYLRTGSIIPGIIGHFLWDFMIILKTGQVANGDMQVYSNKAETVNQFAQTAGISAESANALATAGSIAFVVVECIFWTIVVLILLRKSKREEIMQNFAKN